MRLTRSARRLRLLLLAAIAGGCEDSEPGAAFSGPPWWLQTPPFVVASTSPAAGATGVDLCAVITVTFNRDADPASVTLAAFSVNAGGPVAGTVSYDGATRTARFTPAGLFAQSALHAVTLTAGILSASGEPLAPGGFAFTTAGPLARVSSIPAPGTPNIPINTNVTVTFDKVAGPCAITRVIPGNSAGSLLYLKVARIPTCGTPMPPSSAMSAADVDAIRDWIDEGAPNN